MKKALFAYLLTLALPIACSDEEELPEYNCDLTAADVDGGYQVLGEGWYALRIRGTTTKQYMTQDWSNKPPVMVFGTDEMVDGMPMGALRLYMRENRVSGRRLNDQMWTYYKGGCNGYRLELTGSSEFGSDHELVVTPTSPPPG